MVRRGQENSTGRATGAKEERRVPSLRCLRVSRKKGARLRAGTSVTCGYRERKEGVVCVRFLQEKGRAAESTKERRPGKIPMNSPEAQRSDREGVLLDKVCLKGGKEKEESRSSCPAGCRKCLACLSLRPTKVQLKSASKIREKRDSRNRTNRW